MKRIQKLCCWGTDCCKCQFIKFSRIQNIKLGYISFIFILILIIGLITKFKTSSPQLKLHIGCDKNVIDVTQCVREKLAFLWFITLAFMHLILCILSTLRNEVSKIFNEGVWIIKIIFVIGIGFLFKNFAPFGFINFFQTVSTYMIPIWYFFQNIIIIDMIYTFDITLTSIAQKHNIVHLVKAVFSILSIIGAVIINVFSYINFRGSTQRLYIPILNSIEIVIFFFIMLLRIAQGNSPLVYGLVMLYNNTFGYYMRYPANQLSNSIFPFIQYIFVAISLLYILLPGSNKIRTKKSSLNQIFALNTSKEDEDNRYVSSNKWIIFHVVFFMISLMLTWIIYQNNASFPPGNQSTSTNWFATFQLLRIIGWFMIILFYCWTLITAKLYPQTDFNQLQNYFKEFQLK